MALVRLILPLGAALLLAACPRPGLQPLAGKAALPGARGSAATGTTAPSEALTLRGQVENARFKVATAFGDYAPNSVVSVLDPVSGDALGTAITAVNGTFTMQLPQGWVPDDQGKAYVMEAVKGGRINGAYNFAGAPAIRMRTLLVWNRDGKYWKSLTNTASESAIVISRSTTALAVSVALRQAAKATPAERALFAQFLEGTLKVGQADGALAPPTPDTYTKPAQNTILEQEYHTMFGLVDRALLNGQDPVGSIAWDNQGSAQAPHFVLVPQGFMLSGLDKVKGSAGTRVTAFGGGFPQDVAQIQVVFSGGAAAQTVSVDPTGTILKFDVPVGARTGPLTLRVTLPGSSSVLTLAGPTFTVPTSDGHTVVDSSGNLWVAGRANNTVWTLSPAGGWTRKASGISLAGPRGLTLRFDPSGLPTAYFTSWNEGTVFRLSPGTNQTPVSMSQGLTNRLRNPWGIAAEASGSYLVSSFGGNEVRRIFENGTSVSVASISQPAGVAIDPQGNGYVASWLDGALYRVSSASPVVTTQVMSGLARPGGVAIQPDGTIVVACYGSNSLVRMAADGTILPPLSPRGTHLGIIDVASDDQGRLFVGAFDSHTLSRIDPTGAVADLALAPRNVWGLSANSTGDIAIGIINDLWPYAARPRDSRVYVAPFAAGSYQPFVAIDGFGNPEAVTWDASGDLYVADADADQIVKITRPPSGPRTTIVRNMGRVAQLAVDQAGKLLIAGLDGPLTSWSPAQPSTLARFGGGRTFWAIARNGASGLTYLAGPRDGQIVEISPDLATVRNVALVPGAAGLTVTNGSLYALAYDTGDLFQINSTSGATTSVATVGTTSIDVAAIGNDFFVATAAGAIRKVPITGGTAQTIYQIPGGDFARRLIGRSVPAPELYFTTASASTVVKLGNLSGAAGATTVATFAPPAGAALPAEVGAGTLNGLSGLAFDSVGNLFVAQSAGGMSRIFRLAPGFAADQTGTAPWSSVDAPIMGMIDLAVSGNDTLLTANPQEGIMSSPGPLDASVGFAIRTGDKAVSSLGVAIGRLLGIAPVPPTGASFYLLSSPAFNSTAISLVTSNAWRRIVGTAPCCGANHPFVDTGGALYVPSYTGTLGVQAFTLGGSSGQVYGGETYGAMSGVVSDVGRSTSFVGGSLGGGAGNAPLLRFGPAGASPLDNWPYEPSF